MGRPFTEAQGRPIEEKTPNPPDTWTFPNPLTFYDFVKCIYRYDPSLRNFYARAEPERRPMSPKPSQYNNLVYGNDKLTEVHGLYSFLDTPCIPFEIHYINYYSKLDMPVGIFLEELCFNRRFRQSLTSATSVDG